MDKIYSIKKEDIVCKVDENIGSYKEAFAKYTELTKPGHDMTLAYVGKHFAIAPNEQQPGKLEEADFQPHLLVELRLFNEKEEHFVTTRDGKLLWRIIESTNESNPDGENPYIEKCVQLRKSENESRDSKKNDQLKIRQYLSNIGDGYEMVRFMEIKQKS